MSLALAPASRTPARSTVLLERPRHPVFTTVLLGLASAVGFLSIWLALVPDAAPQPAGGRCDARPAAPHCAPAAGARAISPNGAGMPAAPGR